jgi:DNA mismatch endonuclease Vsr
MASESQKNKNMQAVKSKGSKIETMLGKELWKSGYRYRKNDKTVFGKPDFTYKGLKIAVFCDSEFWHGKNWEERKHEHKTNKEFWHNKIERNIKRDIEVNKKLQQEGWKVFRFWGNEIMKNPQECAAQVIESITDKISNVSK